MYQFVKELVQLKCPPLQVHEIDLAANYDIADKVELEESDVRPNFSKEILEKGYVEFPVFRDETITPDYSGKFCDYTVKRYGCGNVVEVTQRYGLLELNANDEQYTKPTTDSIVERHFRFYYCWTENRFKQENNEERWSRLLDEAEEIKRGKHVLKLIRGFYRFYQEFWINREQYKKAKGLSHHPTANAVLDYCYALSCQLEEIRNFIYIQYVFGHLSEMDRDLLLESLEGLKIEIQGVNHYCHEISYDQSPDVPIGIKGERLFAEFQEQLKSVFQPAYYIHPIEERHHPNLGLYYSRSQKANSFRNAESIKAEQQDILAQAKKAYKAKGKPTIMKITDYSLAYVKN